MSASDSRGPAWLYRRLIRRPSHLIGVSIARILFGCWALLFFLQGWPARDLLWGRMAPESHRVFLEHLAATGKMSLLTFSDRPGFLTAGVVLGIISSALVILGCFTRASMTINTVLLWSFHARNNHLLDGGDNLGRILLLFLIAMNCSAFLSIDARIGWRLRRTPLRNMIHNFGLLAIGLQLCVVYLIAGMSKLTGSLWQNGTAMYYVLNNREFSRVPWAHDLADNYVFVTGATYFTIATQLSFVALAWSRRGRLFAIGSLIVLHLGIAYFMGLVRFSLVMIASLVLLIPDDQILVARRGVTRFPRRFVRPGLGRREKNVLASQSRDAMLPRGGRSDAALS